ncbi:Uu.00g125350.m01.CDS01 [Anthostomella pinea]|uniref:Uu.00g125350.m01.CDS01 n=1 Tax=Anthostomella pinea TaxID=933095 RepID=A0AAI8VIF7_9PEZI|nr:Uu.00g125350.m01.CDS01 [Anthostomella pinea]
MADACQSSVGIEAEFLVAVRVKGRDTGTPAIFAHSSGSAIILTETQMNNIRERGSFAEAHIKSTIQAKISERPKGDRVVVSDDETLTDFHSSHLRNYTDWVVKTDPTVSLSAEPDQTIFYDPDHPCEYFAIEITSPAFWATEASWAEIHAVFKTLSRTYWTLKPRTSALHFHYGGGKNWIPLGRLRRIAALAIAADPVLAQLHPAHMHVNLASAWCRSNRLYTFLAHGMTAAEAKERIGRVFRRATEPETPPTDAEIVKHMQGPSRETLGFQPVFARGELKGFEFSSKIFKQTAPEPKNEAGANNSSTSTLLPVSIATAAREILHASSHAEVLGELMKIRAREVGQDRPAYNFNSYTKGRYIAFPAGQRDKRWSAVTERTVEFRLAAGTLNPDKIWAGHASLGEFWALVRECALGKEQPELFDVFDLLARLGLGEQARVLQRSVAAWNGRSIVDEQTGAWEKLDDETVIARYGFPLDVLLVVLPAFRSHTEIWIRHSTII